MKHILTYDGSSPIFRTDLDQKKADEGLISKVRSAEFPANVSMSLWDNEPKPRTNGARTYLGIYEPFITNHNNR